MGAIGDACYGNGDTEYDILFSDEKLPPTPEQIASQEAEARVNKRLLEAAEKYKMKTQDETKEKALAEEKDKLIESLRIRYEYKIKQLEELLFKVASYLHKTGELSYSDVVMQELDQWLYHNIDEKRAYFTDILEKLYAINDFDKFNRLLTSVEGPVKEYLLQLHWELFKNRKKDDN